MGEEIMLFNLPPVKQPKNKVKGYRGMPGAGPDGETCRTCKHSYYRQYSKRYWKCALVKETHSTTTDIRLKSPACQFWEGEDNANE